MRGLTNEEKMRIGALIKERKEIYSQYNFERIRRELMAEIAKTSQSPAEFSKMQMYLAWYVLEGAGVVPRNISERPSRSHQPSLQEAQQAETIAALQAEVAQQKSTMQMLLRELGVGKGGAF